VDARLVVLALVVQVIRTLRKVYSIRDCLFVQIYTKRRLNEFNVYI
jgi:hypothetical protein